MSRMRWPGINFPLLTDISIEDIMFIMNMSLDVDQVSTAEAKQRLSELINRVYYGQRRVVITSRGKPKVVIVSLREMDDLVVSPSSKKAPEQNQEDGLALANSIRKEIAKSAKKKLTDPVAELRRMREERDRHLVYDLR